MPKFLTKDQMAAVQTSLPAGMIYLFGFHAVYDDRDPKRKVFLDPDDLTKQIEPFPGIAAVQTAPNTPDTILGKGLNNELDGMLADTIYVWGLNLIYDTRFEKVFYRHPITRLCYNPYKGMPALVDPDSSMRYFQLEPGGVIHRTDGYAVEYLDHPEDSMCIIEGHALATGGHLELARKMTMEPEKLTLEDIYKLENEEAKRIAIERLGIEKFIELSDAEVMEMGENPIEGTTEALYKMNADKTGRTFFTYFCGACVSTGRMYFIRVPNENDTLTKAREFMSGGLSANTCVGAS